VYSTEFNVSETLGHNGRVFEARNKTSTPVCPGIKSASKDELKKKHVCLIVEFLLKTDSGYSKDTGVTLFTFATIGNPLRYNTHQSALY